MGKIPDAVWDGQKDYVDFLCRDVDCRQLVIDIEGMPYRDLRKIQADLDTRVRSMRGQIKGRLASDPDWLKRAKVALSFAEQKLRLVIHRIDLIQANQIQSIDHINDADPRIDLIRGLLHFIDNRKDSTPIPEKIMPLIDAARMITDSGMIGRKFQESYYYDPSILSIVDEDGIAVAKITAPGYMRDEVGRLLASAKAFMLTADKDIEDREYVKNRLKCDEINHDPLKCYRCKKLAILDEFTAIIDSLK